jgi:hypothetical protein
MKTMIVSALAGLALTLPVAAYAQDSEAGLSTDVRYCMKLERGYVATHPASRLSDGTVDMKADCVADPEGGITNISIQMHSEGMPIPPRP